MIDLEHLVRSRLEKLAGAGEASLLLPAAPWRFPLT
jgi:hypothetical protein